SHAKLSRVFCGTSPMLKTAPTPKKTSAAIHRRSPRGIAVRGSLPPEQLGSAVRAAVHDLDSAQPIYQLQTMERILERSVGNRRLYVTLLGIFAGIALLLALAGIYGVLSYLVTLRTREFGVRLALGASPSNLLADVLRQGAILAVVGLAAGVVGALVLARFLGTMLYGVGATDPATYLSVALLLGVAVMAASIVPAIRATRVDPMVALRSE
ncbi:MAG: FtsX-like permease family protein, partial [Bryobacteraceae bacterium]